MAVRGADVQRSQRLVIWCIILNFRQAPHVRLGKGVARACTRRCDAPPHRCAYHAMLLVVSIISVRLPEQVYAVFQHVETHAAVLCATRGAMLRQKAEPEPGHCKQATIRVLMVQAVIEARSSAVSRHGKHAPPIEADWRHVRLVVVALQGAAHGSWPFSLRAPAAGSPDPIHHRSIKSKSASKRAGRGRYRGCTPRDLPGMILIGVEGGRLVERRGWRPVTEEHAVDGLPFARRIS